MEFKVKSNSVMQFIFLAYLVYVVRYFNPIVLIFGIAYVVYWYCTKDLSYRIEDNKLIINRIIGKKEIRVRDIEALIDPIPVMYRLNPRPGTLALYEKDKKKLHLCPEKQVEFTQAMNKANKKINIRVKSYKAY